MGYYNNSKAYKFWVPRTNTVLKARDAIFDKANHIERVTIHGTDNDDLPDLWTQTLNTTFTKTNKPLNSTIQDCTITDGVESFSDQQPETHQNKPEAESDPAILDKSIPIQEDPDEGIYEPEFAPKDFQRGPWLDPKNSIYSRGK